MALCAVSGFTGPHVEFNVIGATLSNNIQPDNKDVQCLRPLCFSRFS